MINTGIADSKGVAKLSPKALALFCLLIPHFNPHGKMRAGAGTIKELACPYIKWLTPRTIPGLLTEISKSTSVKYFSDETGRLFLHSLKFTAKHQKLNKSRMGKDYLPDYQPNSRSSHGLILSEGEGELEGEREEEVKKEKSARVSEKCIQAMTEKYPQYDIPANLEQFYDYCKSSPERAKKPYEDHDAAFRQRLRNDLPKIMKAGVSQKRSSGEQTALDRLNRHRVPQLIGKSHA